MRTSGPGSSPRARRGTGFTLIELLVVVAIIAIGTAGVALALRDNSQARLEREAERLSALFESARAASRSAGLPVVWHPVEGGFRFEGLPRGTLPEQWLHADTLVVGEARIVLGPEPVIGRQAVVLGSAGRADRTLRIGTDGLRPFAVGEEAAP